MHIKEVSGWSFARLRSWTWNCKVWALNLAWNPRVMWLLLILLQRPPTSEEEKKKKHKNKSLCKLWACTCVCVRATDGSHAPWRTNTSNLHHLFCQGGISFRHAPPNPSPTTPLKQDCSTKIKFQQVDLVFHECFCIFIRCHSAISLEIISHSCTLLPDC